MVNSRITLFGGKLVFPVEGTLYKALGFALTRKRLNQHPGLPVLGCRAESDNGETDGESDDSDESEEDCANQAVVARGRSAVMACDINLFHRGACSRKLTARRLPNKL